MQVLFLSPFVCFFCLSGCDEVSSEEEEKEEEEEQEKQEEQEQEDERDFLAFSASI